MRLKFASWNLQDYGMGWHAPNQNDLVQRVIQEIDPDVLAVQEICGPHRGPDVLAKLASMVGMECVGADGESAIAAASGDPASRFHVGLLWRAGLTPWAPYIDRPAAGELWHGLVIAYLNLPNGQLRFASYHGRPFGRDLRPAECERVAAAIVRPYEHPIPTLVGADWNAISADLVRSDQGGWEWHHPDPLAGQQLWHPAWSHQAHWTTSLETGGPTGWYTDRTAGEVLRDNGLRDAAALLRKPFTPTAGHGQAADHPPRAIDQIRVTVPWVASAVIDHWVVNTPAARSASDHLPVVCEIETDYLLDPSYERLYAQTGAGAVQP